jgi:hypothetical protein
LWLEYNTSSHLERGPADRGPLVAYARNIVMLKNVADPKNLFERPVGSGSRAAAAHATKRSP